MRRKTNKVKVMNTYIENATPADFQLVRVIYGEIKRDFPELTSAALWQKIREEIHFNRKAIEIVDAVLDGIERPPKARPVSKRYAENLKVLESCAAILKCVDNDEAYLMRSRSWGRDRLDALAKSDRLTKARLRVFIEFMNDVIRYNRKLDMRYYMERVKDNDYEH